jgi:hypothetical protein
MSANARSPFLVSRAAVHQLLAKAAVDGGWSVE